jgi:hypothetical protein
MTNCLITQLKSIIFLQHLTRLIDSWNDAAVDRRMEELDAEHLMDPEHRKLYDEYSQLIDMIENTGDKELRYNALFELDIVIGDILAETGKFLYLAGINDAIQVNKNFLSAT